MIKLKTELLRPKVLIQTLILCVCLQVRAGAVCQGDTLHAAFIGNSYTSVNNLPQITSDLATSAGDVLITGVNAPGGYTFQLHSSNSSTISLIEQGIWDYVVLQEQSQLPSFPDSQVETEVYPFAGQLDSLVSHFNPCGETVFYMTWGYENGDQTNCPTWPPVCTYQGMDSLLQLRYSYMAQTFHADLSPVGKVRRFIRDNYPSVSLYQADGSHPTLAASYIAACCFYTVFFQKDPTLITDDYTLAASDAQLFRNTVKQLVFDSLSLYLTPVVNPVSEFSYTTSNDSIVSFNNLSQSASSYYWDFGDGYSSVDINPLHSFSPGDWTIMLISTSCSKSDTSIQVIHIFPSDGINFESNDLKNIKLIPNPVCNMLSVRFEKITCKPEICIYDLTGLMVYKEECDFPDQISILCSGFTSGLYNLVIREKTNGKILTSQRFVKE